MDFKPNDVNKTPLEEQTLKIPKRILTSLLSSLSAGVVPRSGAPYIAIGRTEEIKSLLNNLEAVKEGSSFVRFLIGRYGSGKSFLIQLLRGYAMEKNFLCADVDLSPERRLTGGKGCGLATYRELIRNLACKSNPDGGALETILSRHVQSLQSKLASDGIFPDDDAFDDAFRKRLFTDFEELESGVGGFDFSRVVWEYFHAQRMHDENRKSACLRYLRGEFANKTEAKQALGFSVSSVIDDDSWYDTIKLFSRLAVSLGFAGFVVFVDECINLYKIPNRISREANYEKLLTIFNDTLQGRAPGLGIVFGGTPQFLEDTRRGLFSYEALRSRLADSRFLSTEYTTMMSPVIRLRRLSDEELLALLFRLTKLFSQQYPLAKALTKEQMEAFLKVSFSRAGAQEMLTPRDLIRDYLTVLHVLLEHPSVTFEEVLAKDKSLNGQDTDAEDDDIEDDLFDFAL